MDGFDSIGEKIAELLEDRIFEEELKEPSHHAYRRREYIT
jgi:hypothetical protein